MPLLCVFTWQFGFELPKIMGLIWGGFMLFLLSSFESGFRLGLNRPLAWLLFAWWISLLVSSILGVAVDKMWWGSVLRWQGMMFYSSIFLLCLSIGWWKDLVLRMWWIASVVSVLLGLSQWRLWQQSQAVSSYAGRMVSSFGEPNYWADFLLVGFVWWWFEKRSVWGRLIGLIVVLAGLFLAKSRLSMVLFVGVIMVDFLRKKMRLWWLLVLVSLFLLLYEGYINGVFDQRLAFWSRAIEKISLRPWQGYGVETIDQVYEGFDFGLGHRYWVDRTHNLLLDMGMYGGIQTIAAWVGINVVVGIKLFKKGEKGALMTLVVWQVLSFIHVVGTVSWVFWALIVGVAITQGEQKKGKISWFGGLVAISYMLLTGKMLWENFSYWMN